MNFELSKEFIQEVQDAIERQDVEVVRGYFAELHAADVAETLDELTVDEARYVFILLDKDVAAEVLVELDEDTRARFLKSLTPEEIAQQIDRLDTDDAADLLGDMTTKEQEEVLHNVDDQEQASDIADLLNYDEDTAGGLMAKEFIKARVNWPVNRCVVEMRRQAEEVSDVYSVYVVDENDKLQGILSLKRLLFASPKTLIKDLYMEEGLRSVRVDESAEEVARVMERYDLVAVPVVDLSGKLVGRITIDDVVDVIREEADKDYQLASGISEKIEIDSSLVRSIRSRLPWLLIGLLGGMVAARVIEHFEGQISLNPALAYFIPLIPAMGGNVGVQSSAIIVQGLANKSLGVDRIIPQIGREALLASLNGLICGALILVFSVVTNGDLKLGITVGVALFMVIMFAACMGTLVPLLLHKRNIDPALATGPFITTTNDILGLTVYFLIGAIIYGMA